MNPVFIAIGAQSVLNSNIEFGMKKLRKTGWNGIKFSFHIFYLIIFRIVVICIPLGYTFSHIGGMNFP